MNGGRAWWKVWVPGLVLLSVMVVGVTGNVMRGNYMALLLLGGALLAAGIMVFASQFRARLLFRDKTPEGVIAHYHSLVRRIPHADAAAAYLSAMAAAAYGDFARAHQELSFVQWRDKPAMYRSQYQYALATLALMEEQDAEKALALARQGRELDLTAPGGGVQVVFHVIETVAGAETAEGIERLEATAKRKSGLVPALALWALALHYQREGRTEDAKRCTLRLRGAAPNCKSLVQVKS